MILGQLKLEQQFIAVVGPLAVIPVPPLDIEMPSTETRKSGMRESLHLPYGMLQIPRCCVLKTKNDLSFGTYQLVEALSYPSNFLSTFPYTTVG